MSLSTKTCSKCDGPLNGAHKSYCKSCQAEYAKANRLKHPGAAYEASKRWMAKNPEAWKRIRRNCDLKRQYGISLHDFERMLEAQDFKCAICHGELKPWPYVDHDHTSGKVREILCGPCNLSIGLLKDNPDIVDSLALYLRRHSQEG